MRLLALNGRRKKRRCYSCCFRDNLSWRIHSHIILLNINKDSLHVRSSHAPREICMIAVCACRRFNYFLAHRIPLSSSTSDKLKRTSRFVLSRVCFVIIAARKCVRANANSYEYDLLLHEQIRARECLFANNCREYDLLFANHNNKLMKLITKVLKRFHSSRVQDSSGRHVIAVRQVTTAFHSCTISDQLNLRNFHVRYQQLLAILSQKAPRVSEQ